MKVHVADEGGYSFVPIEKVADALRPLLGLETPTRCLTCGTMRSADGPCLMCQVKARLYEVTAERDKAKDERDIAQNERDKWHQEYFTQASRFAVVLEERDKARKERDKATAQATISLPSDEVLANRLRDVYWRSIGMTMDPVTTPGVGYLALAAEIRVIIAEAFEKAGVK